MPLEITWRDLRMSGRGIGSSAADGDWPEDRMARKVILDVDPGIDDAVAMCLALADPSLGRAGGDGDRRQRRARPGDAQRPGDRRAARSAALAAVGGGVDRPDAAGRRPAHLFGADGLCGAHFPVAERHHQHPSVKVICDEVRAAPGDVTIIATGPLSNIAAALQQQPDLASLDRPPDHSGRHARRARAT